MSLTYVAVFGSRDWIKVDPIREALESLDRSTIIITGDAPGADAIAFDQAHDIGLVVLSASAPWHRLGHAAGPRRNMPIADIAHRGFAFRFDDEADPTAQAGRGTRNCLKLFNDRNKLTQVIIYSEPRPVGHTQRYYRRVRTAGESR